MTLLMLNSVESVEYHFGSSRCLSLKYCMEIIAAVTGTTVARLDEDEWHQMVESGQTVRDLKQVLSVHFGCPRFRQRLLGGAVGELQDNLPL